MILFLSTTVAQAAVFEWTGAVDNDWTDSGNWLEDGAATGDTPDEGDDVIIPVTINPSDGAAGDPIGSLEVKLGAILHINDDNTIEVDDSGGRNGNVNNAGTINIAASTAPGAAGDGTLTVDGTLLNTGVINMGDGTNDAEITAGTLNNVGLAPVTGTGTIRGISGSANTIGVSGDWTSAGTFIAEGITVTLSGTGNLSHTSINGFEDLTISGGTRTLISKLVVDELDIDAGATFNAGSNYIDVDGDVDLEGRMTATGGTQKIDGDLDMDDTGVYDNNASNVAIDITGNLIIPAGAVVILGTGDISVEDVDNDGQLTSTSGNLSVESDFDNTGGVFNHNGGTIIFINDGDFTPIATTEYNNITKIGLGTETELQTDLTMVGALTVESGTFDADDNDITVSGNVSVAGNTLDMGDGDLILNPLAGATQTFDPGTPSSSYYDMTKQGAGITQLINNPLVLSLNAAGDTGGSLLVDAGTFAMGEQDVTIPTATTPGTLTVSDMATLTDVTGTLTVVGGATTINGTFSTSGVATHRFDELTVSVDGFYNNDTNAVTVNATSLVTNYGNMRLGSGSVDFIDGLDNDNILTSTSGNLSIVGDLDNGEAGAVFNHNGGTVTFGGGGEITPGTSAFNNITKVGKNTTTNLEEYTVLNVLGTLNIEAGTFEDEDDNTINAGAVVIGVDGQFDLDEDSSLNVSGDFVNNADDEGFYMDSGDTLALTGEGTFNPGPSSADYGGTLLTSGTITLAEGSIFNFAGATWTNTGTFNTGTNTTVKFNRSGDPQTLTTGGAPGVPAMNFVNVETDNDGTITFATAINLSGTLTVAGGATLRDVTPGSVYNFTDTAEVVVSGTWTLTGSAASHIQLLGPGGGEGTSRWTLQLNSSGTVNINYIDLRDSELITHGGSLNGKNVGNTVISFGNLSPSWGPFDPLPVAQEPTVTGDVTLALVTTNPGASSATAAVGDTVNLQLVLTSSEGVNGISAYLSFDPTVLSVVDVSEEPGIQPFAKGDFIGGLPFENIAGDGVLRYTEGSVSGGVSGTGVVGNVSFVMNAAPEGGSTAINFLSDVASGLATSVSCYGGATVQPALKGFILNVGSAPALQGDANGDGSVNLADFSILASVFGTANASADFNGDGYVNLADFSILAANFGQSAVPTAPVASVSHSAGRLSLRIPAKLHRGDIVEVAVVAEDASLKAYSFALGYDASMLQLLAGGVAEGDFLKDTLFVATEGDATENSRVFSATRSDSSEGTGVLTKLRFRVVAGGISEDAIALRDVQMVDGSGHFSRLPELHATLRTAPHKTRLLANYPNPFNPETWIPFELADDAKIKVQIYDISGRLVRTLDLGCRPAGHYADQSAAAYWDGRNFSGERVASGMYLYRLTAGDFSAMRRMVILK